MTKKIKLKISKRLVKKRSRRNGSGHKKVCKFCGTQPQDLDYKNAGMLRSFITERGKILPSRISGCCTKHQRHVSQEIRKARTMALLPYTTQFQV